jgi:hypothetical protein
VLCGAKNNLGGDRNGSAKVLLLLIDLKPAGFLNQRLSWGTK